MDAEQIFGALYALWKGDGATGYAILQQPVLMRLEFVIQEATKQTGLADPPDSTVAEACRSCIKEATDKLPTPEKGDALHGRDMAQAARIVFGLDSQAAGLSFRGRRELLMKRLGMSENQVAHKRGTRFTFEEKAIYGVAVVLAEREAGEPHGQDEPLNHTVDDIALTELPSHFEIIDYRAQLTVDEAQIGPRSETARTFRVFRSLLLRATRDRARHYCHIDERSNARRWMYSILEGGAAAPRYKGVIDQWDWKVIHTFDYSAKKINKGDLLMLGFGTIYTSPAYGNHIEYTTDRSLDHCQLTLKLPPGLEEVKAFIWERQPGMPESYRTWMVTRDTHGLFVLSQAPAAANCTYGLMYPTITA
jgi:hypothetical protein